MKSILFFVVIALNVMAAPVDEEFALVVGMDKEIFVQAFPLENKEGLAKLYLYSARELDLVWMNVGNSYESAVRVPVPAKELFAYRFPREVETAKINEIKVRAWDIPSRREIRIAVEVSTENDFTVFKLSSYGYFTKRDRPLGVYPVETPVGSGQFRIDILSTKEVANILVWDGKIWAPAQTLSRADKIFYKYRSAHSIEKKVGVNADIKAKYALDGSGFTDKFVLSGTDDALVFQQHSHTPMTREEVAREEQARKQYLLKTSVQAVAQARADAMSANQFMPGDHNIANAPPYPSHLFEGIGNGGPGCATCEGPNYGFHGGVVADAESVGANGQTYRVRFYAR